MGAVGRACAPLVVGLVTVLAPALAAAGIPAVVSNGSLGAVDWSDGYYHHYLNTDNRSIDVYTPQGGYSTGPSVARLVTQVGGPDLVVFDFTTFRLGAGVQLGIVGSLGRPAVIAATGDVTIDGVVRVEHGMGGGATASALGTGTGAGGGGAGPGYYVEVMQGGFPVYVPLTGGGGGGGGSVAAGQAGQASNLLVDTQGTPHQLAGGSAGSAYVTTLAPLAGASGGGAGADRPMWGGPQTYGFGAGGRGGGALMITTLGNLVVRGTIDANGTAGTNSNGGGGGGGGGGGALVLQTSGLFQADATAIIRAEGGAGGVGPADPLSDSRGGAGGGGRIVLDPAVYVSTGLISAGTGVKRILARALLPASDVDGDGKSDVGVFRPTSGAWYVIPSTTQSGTGAMWGAPGDEPVPADYDGDGKTDRAVFRPSAGGWFVAKSTGGAFFVPWGAEGDVPVPADYDGDHKADLAVFRPSIGAWLIAKSSGGAYSVMWGTEGDVPVPADYDGDGRADVGVFRASNHAWYIVRSSGGAVGFLWGDVGDVPVVADYDGDHKADVGVFRASVSTWYIIRSTTQSAVGFRWGDVGDRPIAGDYDGDGKADVVVFRPAQGLWFIMKSSGSGVAVAWGAAGDRPI